jgi:light-regulated signal transduction histidine kinase (bacteriophytochrome)
VEAPSTPYISALGLVVHEMRSPASIVSGYLRLLQQDSDGLSARQRRMVDEAGRACGRMLTLLQEVAELASLEGTTVVPTPTAVQVFDVCGDALKSLAAETEDGPAPMYMCQEPGRSTTVDGNAAWLKRAFVALMAATAREHRTEALECHGFISDQDGCRRAVIAFGPREIFSNRDSLVADRDAFDRWRGGTGLSVPVACRIIEVHGGAVWSPRGADSRAAVWALPIARASASHS